MRKLLASVVFLILLAVPAAWAQQTAPANDSSGLRQEVDNLKKTIAVLEARIAAQEQQKTVASKQTPAEGTVSATDLKTQVNDLDERVNSTEKKSALDRLNWSGDYRFEAHTIRGNVPAYYDGMNLQNLVVCTLWLTAPTSQGGLGMPFDPAMLQTMTPAQYKSFLDNQVATNYGSYQYFTNNLTFNQLKQSMGQFPSAMQQQLMGYLMQAPGVYTPGYSDNTDALFTNRLRLRFNAKVSDNVSVDARLSMYKVFGDSTGVQMFNGQPNTLAIDGTTTRVPTTR